MGFVASVSGYALRRTPVMIVDMNCLVRMEVILQPRSHVEVATQGVHGPSFSTAQRRGQGEEGAIHQAGDVEQQVVGHIPPMRGTSVPRKGYVDVDAG